MSRRAYHEYIEDRPNWKTAMCSLQDLEQFMESWTFASSSAPICLLNDLTDDFITYCSTEENRCGYRTYFLTEKGKNYIRFMLL